MKVLALLALIVLTLSPSLRADQPIAMKAYLAMKQDSDLYVGEGTATTKDFAEPAQALEAARERARASLAESVSVEISSETSEHLQSEDGKSSEKIESKTKSQAHLVLNNVKFMDLKNFPEKGQVTALASLSKEDYRRQLAGKAVALYTLENGMRLNFGLGSAGWMKIAGDSHSPYYGLDLFWHGWLLGVDEADFRLLPGGTTALTSETPVARLWTLSFGRDLTPWHTRLQPYLPLRLAYQWVGAEPYMAHLFGARTGLGLRYWPTDAFCVDVAFSVELPFNESQLRNSAGKPFISAANGKPALARMDDSGLRLGFTWTGF